LGARAENARLFVPDPIATKGIDPVKLPRRIDQDACRSSWAPIMSPWIPVLTQVSLGLLTIVGSGFVVHKLNASKDQREFKRSKLETLFIAVQEFDQLFALCTLFWVPAMRREASYNEVYERYENEMKGKPNYYATAEMLVNLYFPELLEKFRTLRSAADRVTEIQAKFRRAYDRQEDTFGFIDSYLKSLEEFHDTAVGLKKLICEHGKKLTVI
jgi:hypothetical protein